MVESEIAMLWSDFDGSVEEYEANVEPGTWICG
jgi:hypothetical protein